LNGHALSIKRGRKLRFLREICPLKKMTPKSCPVNGTVTGILLRKTRAHNRCFLSALGSSKETVSSIRFQISAIIRMKHQIMI
jgi:hypothetical protein